MGLFIGDVYELTLIYTYLTTTAYNRWFYGVTGGTGNANSCANGFATSVLPAIESICSDDVSFTNLNVRGVRGVSDFDDNPITASGTVASPVEPDFVALGFRFNRTAVGERHGFKRIGGLPDSFWDNGALTTTALTAIVAAAPSIGGQFTDSGITYVSLIQNKFRNKVALVPPEYHTYTTVAFTGVTTQSSRKR